MGNNVFQSPFTITSAAINAALAGTILNGMSSINLASPSGYYAWSGRTVLKSTATGVLALRDFAETISVEQVVEANDIIAQRRGTNPQFQRIYNSYTDGSNYERGYLGWVSNVLRLESQNSAGTGLSRGLTVAAGGSELTIEVAGTNGSFDFHRNGTSGNTHVAISGTGLTGTAQLHTRLMPSINQASVTYCVLDINPTETAIGAGPHYLLKGRVGAGALLFGVRNTGHVEMLEVTDPAAPGANTGLLYCRDNGSGKSQLVVRFPTGAIQVIATEP